MTKTIALEAALDAAAPTQELWTAGQDAYKASQQKNPGNDELAYYAALDAAAPDEAAWIEGRNMLVLNGVPLLPSSTRFARAKSGMANWNNKKGDEHWSAKAGQTLAVRLLIFGIGVIIFLMLRPIVVVSYDSSYGGGSGIVAAIVLFIFTMLAFYVIGEAVIRTARKKSTYIPPTAS